MLVVGRLFLGAKIRPGQVAGAALSIVGVLVVLCRDEISHLAGLRLVTGDLYMILATIAWSFYSWLLMQQKDEPWLRQDWAAFLLVQVLYGVLWSALLAAGEWAVLGGVHIEWSWQVAAALLYVAIGPAILAMRYWGEGVMRAGPNLGAFFINLTPLFTALASAAFLGEAPHLYHALAFALIVGGIAISART